MTYKANTTFFGCTNVGRVRTNNEDAFVTQKLWGDDCVLAIAIDGVGGYEGGEIAAAIASKTIPEYLEASPNGERVELLKQAVTAANNAIFEARETDPEHGQMSCVLTAAIIDMTQKKVSMVHVGDSRLYCFRHGRLKKLSHDHSLVGYREDIGDLTEEEAMHHPQRNVIGRDVGSQRHQPDDDEFIEAQVFKLMPNSILLFCSDGLTDMITSASITDILSQKDSLEDKTNALIEAALVAGGKDNVTAVLVEYQSDEPEPQDPAFDEFGIPVPVIAETPQPEIPDTTDTYDIPDTPSDNKNNKTLITTILCCVAVFLAILAALWFFVVKPMQTKPEPQQGTPMQIGMPASDQGTAPQAVSPVSSNEPDNTAITNDPVEPTGATDSQTKEIEALNKEIDKLTHQIDSLNNVVANQQYKLEMLKLQLQALLDQVQAMP